MRSLFYVALRLDGHVKLFDRNLRGLLAGFPEHARAIAWPPDERFTVVATGSSVHFVAPSDPRLLLAEPPLAPSDLGWAD